MYGLVLEKVNSLAGAARDGNGRRNWGREGRKEAKKEGREGGTTAGERLRLVFIFRVVSGSGRSGIGQLVFTRDLSSLFP